MFNPAKASQAIKNEFIDYISTSFSIADGDYNDAFLKKLHDYGVISKGPLIEINDIFKTGNTLEYLCEKNVLSKRFLDLEKSKPEDSVHKHKLPLLRPLYKHQEEAIDVITTKQLNAVITTGTGSGKTECFLIPILNELLREAEEGTLSPGVRAILIYPMNALANDQMKRLRELLMYFPTITFGVYNGDTKRTEQEAIAQYCDLHSEEACEELRTPLPNELISRERMNETPPHILCTNYAMLEHMLLRPENDKIFAESNFRYVVLDEAHIYTGATGMETALLLRRLNARIQVKKRLQFILTSATLGKKGESEDAIIRFAEALSGEKFTKEGIVFGQREKQLFYDEPKNIPIGLFSKLAVVAEENYASIFNEYSEPYDAAVEASENLYNLCFNSSYYRALRANPSNPTDIVQFAQLLNVTIDQAVAFVHVCSLAYKNGKALIEARYHFFARALEGMYTPLYGDKQLFLERKKELALDGEHKIAVFERAVCSNCGELGIVGKIEKDGKFKKLVMAPQYDDDTIRFFHLEKGEECLFEEFDDENIEDITDDEENLTKKPKDKKYKEYYLCPICGAISEKDDGRPRCEHTAQPLLISEYANTNGKCLNCQSGRYRRFYIGSEAATGVLATALYEELPTKTIHETNPDGIPLTFEGGKQFLAFSDSRSEAAFFASYLDKSYKEFLRRRGLVRVLADKREEIIEEPYSLRDLAEELTKLFVKYRSFKEELTENVSNRELKKRAEKNAWIAILTELVYARRRTSLVSLGRVAFEYKGNSGTIVTAMAKKYSLTQEVCKRLLDYLAMTFAYFGALKIDDDILDADDRKYIFYTDKQKFVALQKTASTDRYSLSWKARNREGKADSFYPNSRVRLVAKILQSDERRANEFLEDYFNNWLISPRNRDYKLEKGNGDIYYMPAEYYIVRVCGDQNAHWYRCAKCGKISTTNIDGHCVENGCDGTLEEIDPVQLFADNHYLSLYNKREYTSLLIREHTAQLSREEGLKYQTDFEKNRIHALSCSTTFEMGVDVGELETVFLRNVPPSAANYTQRAGRAGRSKNASAYSLTYAKLSSHDFNFFNEPQKIITGQIKPPVFKTDNEKIVLRHIYAVVLSYFFKQYPNYFGNNRTTEFLDNGGYDDFVDLVKNCPSELNNLLQKSIPCIQSYDWQEKLVGENGLLHNTVCEYEQTVEQLEGMIKEYADQKDYDKASRLQRSLTRYKAKEMIDFLVRNNVLPKYGFPIDTVELEVTADERQKHELQLSRDLKMAISEYAPGEKIIANNKMYTSRYIKKSFFNNHMDYYYSFVCECPECKTWNYSAQNPKDLPERRNCVACGHAISSGSWQEAIEPRGGFVAESRIDEVPMSRPDKIYRSRDSYIGNGTKIDEYLYRVNGRTISLKSSENDSIMVTSNTKFYVCKVCGFTYGFHDIIKDEKGNKDKAAHDAIAKSSLYINVKRKHRNALGHICNGTRLYQDALNHIYKTDVVVIDFQEYNSDEATMISVVYALLNAMSDVLGIDINDISGCLKGVYNQQKAAVDYAIVLFDTVAGGAGHVRRLLNETVLENVIAAACYRMKGCSCDMSCYNCLRSYYNQHWHEQLDRYKAYEFLTDYIGEISKIETTKVEGKHKIRLLNDGLSTKTETYHYIFSQLDDLCEEKQALLENVFSNDNFEKPDYNAIGFEANGKKGYADLAWIEKKVLLFCQENGESYLVAKDSEYTCILLSDDFAADIEKLKIVFTEEK